MVKVEAGKGQPQIGREWVYTDEDRIQRDKKGFPEYLVAQAYGGRTVMLTLVAPGYAPSEKVEAWIEILADFKVWAEWVSTPEQIDWVLNEARGNNAYRRIPKEMRQRRQSDGVWLK